MARLAPASGSVSTPPTTRSPKSPPQPDPQSRGSPLAEQGTDLRAVVGIPVGQHRGDDPAGVGVGGEMQHSPGPAPLGAVLRLQPLARTTELQTYAVHQQVHWRATRLRP